MEQEAEKIASRVTLDDVREALGDGDPGKTNANKIREILGRGSFVTIQKHIQQLRSEKLSADFPGEPEAPPSPPAEAVKQMWLAAWSAAQTQTLYRLERLAAERDAALAQIESLQSDVEAWASAANFTAVNHEHVVAALKAGVEKAEESLLEVSAQLASTQIALETAGHALAKKMDEAEHAEALAQMAQAVLRQEIIRLTDQVSELKSYLYQRSGSGLETSERS